MGSGEHSLCLNLRVCRHMSETRHAEAGLECEGCVCPRGAQGLWAMTQLWVLPAGRGLLVLLPPSFPALLLAFLPPFLPVFLSLSGGLI